MQNNRLLIILGPTASGKTRLAVNLASVLNGEVISADSRQVFQGMDIGTGKDLQEYHIKGQSIPYHLIDIKKAGEHYNVNEFKTDFYTAFAAIIDHGHLPILCGGTGMYIHSLLQESHYTAVPTDESLRMNLAEMDLDKLQQRLSIYPTDLTAHADLFSKKRLIRAIEIAEYLQENDLVIPDHPKLLPLVVGLTSEVTLRRSRIVERIKQRLAAGMVEEVETLLKSGVSKEMMTFYGLEYKLITAYLFNEITYQTLTERLEIEIRQFAKRQMTFFRKMEKDGIDIHWFDTAVGLDEIEKKALNLYRETIDDNGLK